MSSNAGNCCDMLGVKVVRGKGLKYSKHGQTPPSSYCILRLTNRTPGPSSISSAPPSPSHTTFRLLPSTQTLRTKKKFKTDEPVWNQDWSVTLSSSSSPQDYPSGEEYTSPCLEIMVVDVSSSSGFEELLGCGYLPLSTYLKWLKESSKSTMAKKMWVNLYPTRNHFGGEEYVKGEKGCVSKILLTFECKDSSTSPKIKLSPRPARKMSTPIKKNSPQTFNSNVPAVFNNILNPHQRIFSSNLREYNVLEPTIEQSKVISPERGIENAKKRYEKVLAKKNKIEEVTVNASGEGYEDDNDEEEEEEEEEVRATSNIYRHSDVGVYVPSEGENKVEGVLGKFFKRVHSQISHKQNVGVNDKDSFVSLNDCNIFLTFLGLKKPQLSTLKSDLLSCGLKVSSSNLEFKSVKRIDSPMFVSYFLSKTAAFSNDDIFNLIEGYLSWVRLEERVKDAISNNVSILLTNASNVIDGIDYLSLYQLGNAASANSSLWSWDDCTNLVTLASRLERYNEVLVGGIARVVGGDNVIDRLVRWRVVVNESEEVRKGVGLNLGGSTSDANVGLSTPQAASTPTLNYGGKRNLFDSNNNDTTSIQQPKPTPKSAQLIRAAFRLMSNSTSSALPTAISLFGNFLGYSWVLSEENLTLDGDDVGERMSGQDVMNFAGRRLAVARAGKEESGRVKEWEKDLINLGKGYLAYMRGSDWRRTVLDGVFRPLDCEGSAIDDLFSFGKCVDVRFGVEDCRRIWNKMADEDKTKDVKRAAFLGLFCYYLDKMGVDDGVFKFGIEKWIAMEEARAVQGEGGALTSSRMASVALLRMDMGMVAAVGDWPAPQPQPQETNLRLDLSASFNSHSQSQNQSRVDMSREEKRAIGDLHDFVEKAKQAKESARRMRVRDEHLKMGYMSQSDRISLLQSSGGGGGIVQPPPPPPTTVVYQSRSPAVLTPTTIRSRSRKNTPSSLSTTGLRKWNNSLLHRSAATVIQKEVRRWIVQGMYVFWRSVCRVQRWWRGCWARWGIKVGRRFGIVGAVNGNGNSNMVASQQQHKQQQQQRVQQPQSQTNNIPEESGDMTKMMLQLLLQQQQQLGQLWQQQQMGQQMIVPGVNTGATSTTLTTQNTPQPSGPTVSQLQSELEDSKKQMSERVQALEAERDRELKTLLEFKEMASNHLRAQNLTIKRLSHGRGAKQKEESVAGGIMDRVRNLAIQSHNSEVAMKKGGGSSGGSRLGRSEVMKFN
ncbi:hypothetical protein TL16_g08212 [Triparma laevis f. inornata]|uniref:C2 domain-containing protein n=1 Tax=Triparma laevis f. inornata TaxID=1714386 RepID=A0A9W7B4B4_9STRA|nr:hypothetical protein TL16_g08212 [Triparma laevis f. inornata]